MAKSKLIKDALKALMADMQLDGEPAFTSVLGSPYGEFDGYPSLRVLPGDQSTDKSTVQQNDRTVSYIVRTHVKGIDEAAFDYMYTLTDAIIDTLDTADKNDTLLTYEPTIGIHFLNATRGDWGEEDMDGPVLLCDVNVQVRYSRNN